MDRRRFLKSGTAFASLAAASPLLRSLLAEQNAFEPLSPDQGSGSKDGESLLDLSQAIILAPPELSKREQKAVLTLAEEVEKRSGIRWQITHSWPRSSPAMIAVGPTVVLKSLRPSFPKDLFAQHEAVAAEGFTLRAWTGAPGPAVAVLGADERGVLFGVGSLLRALRMTKGQVSITNPSNLSTSPKYPLRGHQLGYRPKTNSYDGWTVQIWDQYIRDLAVFGTNAIELIPPRSDDEPDSPHFTLPPKRMMVEMSRICDDYGLDVWIWYPAMDKDYSDPKTVDFALNEWGEVFAALPRVDAVFVPGGDPGHTRPKFLLSLLEKQTHNLRRYHPRAKMWVSPQSFDEQWLNEFFGVLHETQPAWLSGVVFGPQNRVDLPTLRRQVPQRYPIRLYPDITHSLQCQFPVPDWDSAYALTEGREGINPRPGAYANIFQLYAPYSIGFIAYSEGCNDDVNKIIWSALGWNPEVKVLDVLRDYSRYFIGERYADDFAQGLVSLEKNWQGALLSNETVYTTLQQFQAMEQSATPDDLVNWRFQQGLYRAYYDAYVRSRLLYETSLENQALDKLGEIRRVGSQPTAPHITTGERGNLTNGLNPLVIFAEAEAILDKARTAPVSQDWRTRILEFGEALYQSIRMQLSVERYKAEAVSRGANLDTLETPLTNGPWLMRQLAELRKLPSAEEQVKAIEGILNRTNPGPGGFYDDLGDLSRQPHLVRGLGSEQDPEFRASSLVGFDYPDLAGNRTPVCWKRWALSLFDAPLKMHYPSLDPHARYKLRVVYSGDASRIRIRLVCNDNMEIHPLMNKPWPPRPLEFDIPPEATARGELTLIWNREPGLGGNGRGCQVAEVWLMKSSDR